MADPLTILGGIQTCETFIKEIYGIINDIAGCPEDVKALQEHFKVNNLLLPKFLDFFRDNKQYLAADVNQTIADVTTSLGAKLAILKYELSKLKDGRGWRRMTWPWVKHQMSEATGELSTWTTKINEVLQNLSPRLRERLHQKFSSEAFNAEDHPLSAILARVRMTDRRQEEDHWTLSDFSHLKKGQANGAVDEPRFEDERLEVPFAYVGAKHKEEQARIELDVAKVVSLLQDSVAKDMHFPKSQHYCTEIDEKGNTKALCIVYAPPPRVARIEPLKEAIGTPGHSLTDRLRVAKELTAALSYIHAVGWVHKGIRTHKIMLCHFKDGNDNLSLGNVTVLGFSFSRRSIEEAMSYRPEGIPEDEMYKHPDRQVKKLDFIDAVNKLVGKRDFSKAGSIARFDTKHDVYSLGVVLLEVGLWQRLEEAVPGIQKMDPEAKKAALLKKVKTLKEVLGNKYAWLVEQCLEVEDPEDVTSQ